MVIDREKEHRKVTILRRTSEQSGHRQGNEHQEVSVLRMTSGQSGHIQRLGMNSQGLFYATVTRKDPEQQKGPALTAAETNWEV